MSLPDESDAGDDPLVCGLCRPAKSFTSLARASGHRRWMHPVPLELDGELCTPPPHDRRTVWPARLQDLDEKPGEWRRWKYGSNTSAYRAARAIADRLIFGNLRDRPGTYLFQAHHLDGHWWVYGIRLTEELNTE